MKIILALLAAALFFAFALAAIGTLSARVLVAPLINWNETTSAFFKMTKSTVNLSYLSFFAQSAVKYFASMLLLSSLLFILRLKIKGVFAYLVTFSVSALNLFPMLGYVMQSAFTDTSSENPLFPMSAVLLYCVIFPVVEVGLVFAFIALYMRKDFFGSCER